MKRLMGKTDVEKAIQGLDTLTKEENLMTAARTFEATHHVYNKVTVIEEVLQQVVGNIRVTQELSVDDNVKVTKRGMPTVSVPLLCTDPLIFQNSN